MRWLTLIASIVGIVSVACAAEPAKRRNHLSCVPVTAEDAKLIAQRHVKNANYALVTPVMREGNWHIRFEPRQDAELGDHLSVMLDSCGKVLAVMHGH